MSGLKLGNVPRRSITDSNEMTKVKVNSSFYVYSKSGHMWDTLPANSIRRFGYPLIKGLPKPKKWEDMHKAYLAHKNYVYNLKKISHTFCQRGPGQSGARKFRAFQVPPLAYWNPDIEFQETKLLGSPHIPVPAELSLHFLTGDTLCLKVPRRWTDVDILRWVVGHSNGILGWRHKPGKETLHPADLHVETENFVKQEEEKYKLREKQQLENPQPIAKPPDLSKLD